jgi:1-acyl-sn-glycerol-3-phosphate acyltransferase
MRLAPKGTNFLYWLGWSFFRLSFATYFRWRVHHADRVPMEGPVILASNHASYLDPPLVGSALGRTANYLGRESLFRYPLVGAIMRGVQAVPVDRDGGGGAGLKAILDRLLKGGAVLLFPEGTRTANGQLAGARSGIGLIVIKSTAPVVPIRVVGTYEAYGRHHKFPRPRRVEVTFGVPLHFAELRAEAQTCSKQRLKEIYQEVANQIMAAIAALPE